MAKREIEIRLDGHRERLRCRALELGWDALKDYELLELILFYAEPRRDTNRQARSLLAAFGSLEGTLSASREALEEVPGINSAMAELIVRTGKLMRDYRESRYSDGIRLFRYPDVADFIQSRLSWVEQTSSWAIYTDFEDDLITYERVCDCLTWWQPGFVNQLVHNSVAMQARRMILILFAPEASALGPELAGVEHILDVAYTLSAVDVELIDCVLVGRGGLYSLKMHGDIVAVKNRSRQMAVHERYME